MGNNLLIDVNVSALQAIPANMQPLSDLVCMDDVDPFARELTDQFAILVQDVYHILIESPGSNLDVPGRGVGIYQLLSGTVDDLNAVARRLENELTKDDRISACSATIVLQPDGTYELQLKIQVSGAALGINLSYSPDTGLRVNGWNTIQEAA